MLSTLETIVSLLNTLILSCLKALRRQDCYHVPYFWGNLWIIYYSFVTKQHSCSIDCMANVLYFEAESLSFLCDSGYLWLTWRSFSATSASPCLPPSSLPSLPPSGSMLRPSRDLSHNWCVSRFNREELGDELGRKGRKSYLKGLLHLLMAWTLMMFLWGNAAQLSVCFCCWCCRKIWL